MMIKSLESLGYSWTRHCCELTYRCFKEDYDYLRVGYGGTKRYCLDNNNQNIEQQYDYMDILYPNKEELWEKAIKDYQVGTIFNVSHNPKKQVEVSSIEKHNDMFVIDCNGRFHINLLSIGGDCASTSVYYDGIWAEIVSKPEEVKQKPLTPKECCQFEIDDWVITSNRDCLDDKYVPIFQIKEISIQEPDIYLRPVRGKPTGCNSKYCKLTTKEDILNEVKKRFQFGKSYEVNGSIFTINQNIDWQYDNIISYIGIPELFHSDTGFTEAKEVFPNKIYHMTGTEQYEIKNLPSIYMGKGIQCHIKDRDSISHHDLWYKGTNDDIKNSSINTKINLPNNEIKLVTVFKRK